MPKKNTGVLDQKFSIKEAVKAVKNPMKAPVMDESFSINQAKDTVKDLFGKGMGDVCEMCGCGVKKPIRSVIHYYDDHKGDTLKETLGKVTTIRPSIGIVKPIGLPKPMPEKGDVLLGEGMRKRRGGPLKGSPEAKAWGEKMRQARMK
jgi:hypothetical protein